MRQINMATCQIMNILTIKVIPTPPGTMTRLAPRGKISVDKAENTSNTISELVENISDAVQELLTYDYK